MVLTLINVTITSDIYFIGGFGTVQWVDVKEYESVQPDKIAADGGEQNLKVSFRFHLSGAIFIKYKITACSPGTDITFEVK